MNEALIILLAVALDLVLGDPPTRFHPVGWMGKTISLLLKPAPQSGSASQFAYGAAIVVAGVVLFAVPVYVLLDYLEDISEFAYILAAAFLLKSVFTIRGLERAALEIRSRLESHDMEGARFHMRSLVSRDTSRLEEPLIVAATVESVAENASDSVVAPLFWFLVLGIPGAVAYRMANTFDSMIGYRGRYEFLGKFAARLDDVLNFVPARLTAIMIVMASFFRRENLSSAWRIMLRDHDKTESPNAGWPMSAAAGALEIELEKIGHYRLGNPKGALVPGKIGSAVSLVHATVAVWVCVCVVVAWLLPAPLL